MYSENSPEFVKIVMLGESKVGKTSLTVRYVKNTFTDKHISTINAYYLEKLVEAESTNNMYKLSIWDTAGQEEFNAMMPMYYRNAEGAILVYDITDRETFARVHKWIKELRTFANPDIAIIIVGNKSDLENIRQVDNNLAEEYANKVGAKHFKGSAKSGAGIQEIFKTLVKVIDKIHMKKLKNNNASGRNTLKIKAEKSEGCC